MENKDAISKMKTESNQLSIEKHKPEGSSTCTFVAAINCSLGPSIGGGSVSVGFLAVHLIISRKIIVINK